MIPRRHSRRPRRSGASWHTRVLPTHPAPTVVTTKTAAERRPELSPRPDATKNDVTFSFSDPSPLMFPDISGMVCDRLINNAMRGDRKGASNAPLAIVAAALAPHSRLWIEAFKDTRRHSHTCQKHRAAARGSRDD